MNRHMAMTVERAVTEVTLVGRDELSNTRSRPRSVVDARHALVYLLRLYTGLSYPEIARMYGASVSSRRRKGVRLSPCHSSWVDRHQRACERMETDARFAEMVARIERNLGAMLEAA